MKKKKVKLQDSETNKVKKIFNLDFPGFGGFGGDDEIEDEDDHAPEEHVHGENCNHGHDNKKANLDDLDAEA